MNPCLCHWCYTLDVLWMFHLSVLIWRNHRVDDLCRHATPGGSLIRLDKSSKNHIQMICFLAADYIDKSHHSVCLQNVHSILEQDLRQVSWVLNAKYSLQEIIILPLTILNISRLISMVHLNLISSKRVSKFFPILFRNIQIGPSGFWSRQIFLKSFWNFSSGQPLSKLGDLISRQKS